MNNSIDYTKIIMDLESAPDIQETGKWNKAVWTKEKDEILLKFWIIKGQRVTSKALGFCPSTCRERYRELTECKD